ncbi:MAG: Two component regulator three Y domain protein [Bacteroidota bacterium]
MKILSILLFALLCNFTLVAQISESEATALKDFYAATHGDHWNQKWDLSKDASHYGGVTIENGHVTEIRMLFNNISGTLPASLSALSELKVLELSFNKLSGPIPASFGDLKKLELLALNGNNLSGSIPQSMTNLTSLKQLHLSSNQLTGALPSQLGRLTKLEVFNVFDNDLSGALPLDLASNRSLKEFMVAENNFDPSSEISTVLLINSSGHLDLKENMILSPNGKSIIAIESSEDEN